MHRTGVSEASAASPWRAVLRAMALVALALWAGGLVINVAFDWRMEQIDPRYTELPGTCYFAGDARNYMRIALNGYTNYDLALLTPHYTQLNDRSWWPLFPAVAASVIALGGGQCSGQIVNVIALVLFVPVWGALTGERRAWRLALVAALPFGAWLFIGGSDSFYLLLSGLLILACRRGEHAPRAASLLALGLGLLVGVTKPNSLGLAPALGVWALTQSRAHRRARAAESDRRAWRLLLDDANPGWAPLLGALGIALGNAWWLYQTSGHYPFWVLMIQRSLWWDEFVAWSPQSFGHTFYTAIYFTWHRLITMNELVRMVELAAMLFGLALSFAALPPRWPGGERLAIPLHWRVGIWTMVAFVAGSGQTHAFDRYTVSNVFVLLAWHRVLFGDRSQRVTWRIWTLPGLLRWVWLLLGPVLWLLSFLLLGWEPLS